MHHGSIAFYVEPLFFGRSGIGRIRFGVPVDTEDGGKGPVVCPPGLVHKADGCQLPGE
jgi:hypothetical protein